MRRCPACIEPLLPEVTEDGDIERCPGCQGIWISADDLHRRARPKAEQSTIGGLDVRDVTVADARRCPACDLPLRTALDQGSGVQVDWCTADGVWLDHLELERIMGTLPKEGGRRWRGRLADIADAAVALMT